MSKNDAISNPQWIVNDKLSRLVGVVMLHVDDMLFTGTAASCDAFVSCISALAHSPVQYLSLETDLAFAEWKFILILIDQSNYIKSHFIQN